MVYAAKEGWYKEESNMNTLLPQDILRISTILKSWGDIDIAKKWITSQKARLRGLIQEELDFKLGEIVLDAKEDIEQAEQKLKKADKQVAAKEADGKKPTKTQLNNQQKAKGALEKFIAAKEQRIADARDQAEKERIAIDEVEQELLTMLPDPELRKRYFSVVDMDELEENEYNLNIPRYVDTFEPELEIDLKEAIKEFKASLENEAILNIALGKFLDVL